MIKYETDTPVQGEYREAALSALEKFKKHHEILRAEMSDVDKIWDERSFNYEFPVGTSVVFDVGFMFALSVSNYTFVRYIHDYEKYFKLTGKVVRCHSDLHAFGRGYSYSIDVDFNGTLVKDIIAAFLIVE
jgi:hypothetical protein